MTSPAAADIDPRKTTIVVEKLNKSFNGTPVLHDINLNVKAGELLALLGPSGSGKTTLLRLIAGLETPDNGRISFAGADTTRVPVQKREVGFVFQHYALFKHMTVADNISYGLRARRRSERPSKSEISERVAALLDLIKLGTFADRYPSQLSGGQRQRVALARALAVEPRVLLLDEPFGALDAQVRKDLRRWLREIHERTGQTTLFVTHDQDEALELSDRVAVLHAGRVEQVGTPAEVQDHPSSVPVLKFLGDAAEISAHVRAGKLWIDGIATQIDAASHADGPANLYVRPWHFAVANSEAAHVSGIVRSIYRAQGKAHVGIDVPQGFFNAQLAESAPPKIGDPIDLKITGGHVFR